MRLLVIVVVGVCLAFLCVAWLLFRSDAFRVQRISIRGTQSVSDEEVKVWAAGSPYRNWLGRLFGPEHIFFWPEGTFEGKELAFLPRANRLEVRKNYVSRAIEVIVEERTPVGIWCLRGARNDVDLTQIGEDYDHAQPNADQKQIFAEENQRESALHQRMSALCWWFDADGILFKSALAAEGNLLRVVQDYTQRSIGLLSPVLPQEFLPPLFSIFRVLDASGVNVREVRLVDLSRQEVEVSTHGGFTSNRPDGSPISPRDGRRAGVGPTLYFSLRFTAENAFPVLNDLVVHGVFTNLEYVDFRVENRAYYR